MIPRKAGPLQDAYKIGDFLQEDLSESLLSLMTVNDFLGGVSYKNKVIHRAINRIREMDYLGKVVLLMCRQKVPFRIFLSPRRRQQTEFNLPWRPFGAFSP